MANLVLLFSIIFYSGFSMARAPEKDFLNHFRIDYPGSGNAIVFDLSNNVEVSCAADVINLNYKDEVSTSGSLWWKETEVVSPALKFSVVDRETDAIIESSSLSEFDVTVSGYYPELRDPGHQYIMYRASIPILFRDYSRATRIAIYPRNSDRFVSVLRSYNPSIGWVPNDLFAVEDGLTPSTNFDELFNKYCGDTSTGSDSNSATEKIETDSCNDNSEIGDFCNEGTIYAGRINDAELFVSSQTVYGRNDWRSAKRGCETSRLGGYQDWRLPTEEELLYLISIQNKLPENTGLIPENASRQDRWDNAYWSSEEWQGLVRAVSLDGVKLASSKGNKFWFRCVRSF